MLPAEAVGEVLSRDKLRPGGEIQVFHALVRWAKCMDGGGGCEGGAAGGGGESKEGDQDEGQQFADLLGRCVRTSLLNVRASLLSSKEILRVVMEEPLVRGSNTALRSMVDVLRERVEPLDLT